MFGRLLLLVSALSIGVTASARDVYDLNEGWTFFSSSAVSTDGAQAVDLPHTWNAMNDARGEANYLKTIDVPAAWSGRRVFLRIGGAATVADVFVGSRRIGGHAGGSSAFTVELTDALKPGSQAVLRISVGNSPRWDVLPTAGAENVYGGLFRGVELIVCSAAGLAPDGVRVETGLVSGERVEGEVRLELLGMDTLPMQARVRMLDGEGAEVFSGALAVEGREVKVPFALEKPRLWQGGDDPHLYNIEVVVRRAATSTVDSVVVRTGFRTVGIDGRNKFMLNGRPMRIRGVILHRDRAMVGSAVSRFQIEEDIALVREMGANAVRVAGGQHDDYFYDLCDAAGLLVWNDLAFTGSVYPTDIDFVDTQSFKDNARKQLTEMIEQLGRHPSVVIWGLFSNVQVRPENDPTTFIDELNALAHSLDRGRLTAGSSVQNGRLNTITDLVSFDLPFGWESGPPDGVKVWLRQLRNDFPNLRAGISYSAGGSIFQRSRTLAKPDPQSTLHPESWQTHVHREYLKLAVDAPELWGVFVGNMFDFGSWRYSGGYGNGIDDHGLVTFDRKYRKEAFDLYKDAWKAP